MAYQNLEYSKLVNLLNKSDQSQVYEELMKKEDHVLDTINRVVNFSNEKEKKSSEFLNKSINEHVHHFFWTMNNILADLSKVKNIQNFRKVLFKDDRQIYIGILLVIIALFLFFVIISV
jgi:tetrahydromethanopterin S-methyltransferase subunit A